MARRTFSDILGYVLERLGNRSDATSDLREAWINDALLFVANRYEHPGQQGTGTESLTANTGSLTLSVITDLWWPVSLKNSTMGRFLEPDSYQNIERGTKSNGQPSRYCWWGGVFYFNQKAPTTSAVSIEVRYFKKPSWWTTGNSVLSVEYDLAIELQAAINGHMYFRDFENAGSLKALLKDYERDMKLPVREARKDDHNAGLRPRMR
jgi:hypothetical protein